MAFFKFRKGGDEPAALAPQPESVEALRRRAKNRLIGSAILVLIGVIAFPLLVDQQPRQVASDLPIEIPDRNKVLPLAMPATAEPAQSPASSAAVPAAAAASVPAEPVPDKPAAQATKPEPKTDSKAEAKPGKAEAKKAETRPVAEGRYVVQVGSFADEHRARDARNKLERAGFKSYTQAVDTRDGRRIRVRAGPFASKAEAERAADKIKKLDLPAAVLGL